MSGAGANAVPVETYVMTPGYFSSRIHEYTVTVSPDPDEKYYRYHLVKDPGVAWADKRTSPYAYARTTTYDSNGEQTGQQNMLVPPGSGGQAPDLISGNELDFIIGFTDIFGASDAVRAVTEIYARYNNELQIYTIIMNRPIS